MVECHEIVAGGYFEKYQRRLMRIWEGGRTCCVARWVEGWMWVEDWNG